MIAKGERLNRRVWRLFERAGFMTKPNSNDPSEETINLSPRKKRTVDLCAVARKQRVKIIGWNKARRDLKESLTVHIHDYGRLKEIAKADSVLFVSTEKEVAEEDREYAEEHGMRIWGEQELRYYEAVVDAIGEYAKYEIIHSFGVRTREERNIHNVLALQLRQPYPDSDANLFLFTITPEKLLQTCVIYRKAGGSGDAYQRMLRKNRLRSVKKFVTRQDALLPPNIIVHLGERVAWDAVTVPENDADGRPITLAREAGCELVVLRIPLEYASLELIDGQHRLYGFAEADLATKKTFNLIVLGLAELPVERRRDTFVAINDKSRRMDPNLVAYLRYTEDEKECQRDNELMAIKIVVELNKTSPFKNKIRLLDIGDQKITLKGFCGYDLKGLLGPRGALRQYYPPKSTEYVKALRLYFSILKSLFKDEYYHPEKYIIFTNRGISAFLKLLKSIIKTCKQPLDKSIARKYLEALRDNWEGSWETAQLKNSYVGAKGWKDFHRDLVSAIRKDHADFVE